MEFIKIYDNILAEVRKIKEPRGKGGYSYWLKIDQPTAELSSYLFKGGITLSSWDKEPHFTVGQRITIKKMGITEYQGTRGTTYYAHTLIDEEEIKELLDKPPKETEQSWDKKENAKQKRIARESVLDTARFIYDKAKYDDKDLNTADTVTEEITRIADNLVEWVYQKTD